MADHPIHISVLHEERKDEIKIEPTVGFPTLDFESSALNRTQPPFLEAEKKTSNRAYVQKLRVASVEHPTFASTARRHRCNCSRFGVQRWALDVQRCIQRIAWLAPTRLADRIFRLTRQKMLQL